MFIAFGIIPGTGSCQPVLSCGEGNTPVLSSETGASCECEDGKGEILGKCENLFTQRGCSEGRILLPDNFHLTNQGNISCPAQFSCSSSKTCPGFAETVEEIRNTVDTETKLQRLELMESLVCDQSTRSICCPDFEHNSFLTVPVLLASLKSASKASCMANPCPAGLWPWAGEDGLARCVDAADNVKNCDIEVQLFEDLLICFSGIEVRITTGKRNCGRRRRFKYGRCVRIY